MTESGPYMGSKISLISQAQIRYEGNLYSIDTNESTVTLSQVRTFGTEGRPAARPVAPGDEVYSFIIFKASDIKDLHVCELPKPSNIAQDPAVLQHSGAVRSTPAGYHQGPPFSSGPAHFGSYGGGPYGHFGHVGGGAMPGQYGGQPPHPPPGLSGRGTPPPMKRRSPTMEQGVQASGPESPDKNSAAKTAAATNDKPQTEKNNKDEEAALPQRPQQPRRQRSREENTTQRKEIQRQESKDKKPEAGNKADKTDKAETKQERGDRSGRGQQGPRQNWQSYNRRGRGRGPRSPAVKEPVGTDFDFTTAQFDKTLEEEFKEKMKLEGSSVNGDVVKATEDSGNETQPSDAPEEEDTAYYDSAKSFFDNISCDALNKERQRPNWKEERKMNCETFGIAYARRGRGGYRGGYYRGGYYRGSFQGGRGQGRGGRSYRGNRGRGGYRSQGFNDYSTNALQSNDSSAVKTDKTAEATA